MSRMSELHADLTASPLVTHTGDSIWGAVDDLYQAVDHDAWSLKLIVTLAVCHLDAKSRAVFLTEVERAARSQREYSAARRLTD